MPDILIDWTVIRDWISGYLTTCSICGGVDWDLHENQIWETRQHHPGVGMAIITDEEILVTVALTCKTCKRVLYFNASSILAQGYFDVEGEEK